MDFGVLKVEDSKPENRPSCEHDIVALVEVVVIELCARVQTDASEPKDRQHIDHVFVEHVQNQVAVASVGFSAVDEQQVLQEAELTNAVV